MQNKLTRYNKGILSFLIVLLFMPIGHALMVLNENVFEHQKFTGAFVIGLLGLFCLIFGIKKESNKATATMLGLVAGILVWTGWVEFSFVWMAEKLHVAPMMENGEVATKPEYLVMMSSLGLLLTMLVYFGLSRTKCQFFNWFQKLAGLKHLIGHNNPAISRDARLGNSRDARPCISTVSQPCVSTFVETIMILWTFYIVLLLVYDPEIAGDKHPATYFVAFGSLFWSIYLFLNLVRISKLDYAIRYAIPTVIIFWNFVEVIGRWNLFKEIWVHPFEHWVENLLILVLLLGFSAYYLKETYGWGAKNNRHEA